MNIFGEFSRNVEVDLNTCSTNTTVDYVVILIILNMDYVGVFVAHKKNMILNNGRLLLHYLPFDIIRVSILFPGCMDKYEVLS